MKPQNSQGTISKPDSRQAPPSVHDALKSPARPLETATRSFMESRFNHDFSRVRVHTNPQAIESAQAVNALAYTVGDHIVFHAGSYDPVNKAGRRLLAHELTHVIQQSHQSQLLRRQCLTGSVCGRPTEAPPTPEPVAPVTIDIPGAPGAFGAEASEARSEAREERRREEEETGVRSGQGRRAENFERFGRAQGLDMDRIHGVFVDLNIRREGGYAWECRLFHEFAVPFTGDPGDRCVFIPENRETEARQFLENAEAGTIGGRPRDTWRLQMVALLTHEIQHVVFAESSRPDNPAGRCSLSTIVYRRGSRTYNVRHYLSELSAILSEFPVWYRGRTPSSLDALNWWFDHKVHRGEESISGILTNLRCVCDCDEVDEYVTQTANFTTSSWSEMERTYFNHVLSRQEGVNWPITPSPDSVDALNRVLEARHPGRRHAWSLTPTYTLGYANLAGQDAFLGRLGIDFGIPLDRLRQWTFQIGLHESYIGAGDYQSFLTGLRASVALTTPGTGTSFHAGVFGELGGAAIRESVPGVSTDWRPDVYGQGGLTLGVTTPSETFGRLSLSADILGGSTFGAGSSSGSPWFGIGFRFGVEFFGGGE